MTPLARRRCFLVALALLFCGSAYGQETPHIAVGDKYEVGQKIVAEFVGSAVQGGQQALAWQPSEGVDVEQVGERLFIWAPAGKHTLALSVTYTLQVFTPDPESPTDPTKAKLTTLVLPPYQYEEVFVVGPAPPPVPPTPIPPEPGPDPPTPPVEEGKRAVIILHESADQTPAQAILFTALRNGASADYLKTKGHTLKILDDDSVDPNGQPYQQVKELLALGSSLPALFIIDPQTAKVLHHRPLTPNANAAGVLAIIREHGG